MINEPIPDDVAPMLQAHERWQSELVVSPQMNNLILHGFKVEDIPDGTVKKTGTYWAYWQNPDTLARLAIQKGAKGPLPEMKNDASGFLDMYAYDHQDRINTILATDGAVLSIEQIIAVCRGKMLPHRCGRTRAVPDRDDAEKDTARLSHHPAAIPIRKTRGTSAGSSPGNAF
ncbi:MAG TPA: hypothetical protein VI873_00795 [Candidatus Peribacteraceae bacterium]|nr:hypothetical protein [Candidatus Peribacteraceae bacterium]